MTQYDQYISYGRVEHGEQFQRLYEKTKQIAYVISFLAKTLFNQQLITTSIFRKKTTDSGIHEAYRACDFAPLNSITDTYRLIEIINELYIYDPDRPHLKVCEPPYHGTGVHIHIQAHFNTTHITQSQILAFAIKAEEDKKAFQPVKLGVI